jgi:hypothetical protein
MGFTLPNGTLPPPPPPPPVWKRLKTSIIKRFVVLIGNMKVKDFQNIIVKINDDVYIQCPQLNNNKIKLYIKGASFGLTIDKATATSLYLFCKDQAGGTKDPKDCIEINGFSNNDKIVISFTQLEF